MKYANKELVFWIKNSTNSDPLNNYVDKELAREMLRMKLEQGKYHGPCQDKNQDMHIYNYWGGGFSKHMWSG